MRILCTSVEESKNVEFIEREVKKIFPYYHIAVIPNIYATDKGKEKVMAYSRKHYGENREREIQKQRQRHHTKRIEQAKSNGTITDEENFNKLITNISEYLKNDAKAIFENKELALQDLTKSTVTNYIDNIIYSYINNKELSKMMAEEVYISIFNLDFNNLTDDDLFREVAKDAIRIIKKYNKVNCKER